MDSYHIDPPAIEAIVIESYVTIDALIDSSEADGIEARWQFGKLLLRERVGKQLPKGRLDAIVAATGKSRSELQYRMQFAELCPTRDKVSNALDTCGSWRDIVQGLSGNSESVHFSSDGPEWYTPPELVAKVVEVLGVIDLDPCADAEHRVPAKAHYTQKQNGLSRGWAGKVYMNPPYGRELPDWVVKLCLEYTASSVTDAIALVPARTDTEWFRALRDYPRCFIFGRLKFSGHENSAPFPSMVVYLGKDEHGFINTFRDTGDMYARIDGDT